MRCTVCARPKHCQRHSISFTFVWDGKCIFSQGCGSCAHGVTAMPSANDAFKRLRNHFPWNSWMSCDHRSPLRLILTHLNKIYLSWMMGLFCSCVLTVHCYLGSLHISYCKVSWWLQSLFMKQNKAGSLLKTEHSPRAQKHSKEKLIWVELLSPWQSTHLLVYLQAPHGRRSSTPAYFSQRRLHQVWEDFNTSLIDSNYGILICIITCSTRHTSPPTEFICWCLAMLRELIE